jgi:hypothetical protein
MLVDQGGEDMGCTVVATPWQDHWVLGRNFDFEGGRIFDTEKIVKWVFPDQGHAFVSVIWAGMVGAVTGVNDQGLYISINAAGSKDHRRIGMPSTLVLLKVLQNASNAEEAIKILKEEQMFITDIFVLLDSKSNKLYRIEKSPRQTAVIPLEGPSVVTNHLVDERWKNDATNTYRRENLTTLYRENRGKLLLANLQTQKIQNSQDMEKAILQIIRDKGTDDGSLAGKPLHLGNRRAIDALIAAHSVIYNSKDNVLFVSQGPAVSGPFVGFDLQKSFTQKYPVIARKLDRDPLVSDQMFSNVRTSNQYLSQAQFFLRRHNCDEAMDWVAKAGALFKEQSFYYEVLGDVYKCRDQKDMARTAWKKSLALSPAYKKTIDKLEKLVK